MTRTQLNNVDGMLYLQWDKASDLEVIDSLIGKVSIYNTAGELKDEFRQAIGMDGFVLAADSSISRVTVSELIPVDSFGNHFEIEELTDIKSSLRTAGIQLQ